MIRVATWNLNNRVGRVRFQPEAAQAAVALGADVIVFTEYFPKENHLQFCSTLSQYGWTHQLLSKEPTEKANRVLIVSRLPLEKDGLGLPDFDGQFPANICAARLPTLGLRIIGVRIPAYKSNAGGFLVKSWDWLESAAGLLRGFPALILGDLNVGPLSGNAAALARFKRILNDGWRRAGPLTGVSFYGRAGRRSEIDHILVTAQCSIDGAEYVAATAGFTLAGTPAALSDHAALVADVDFCREQRS